MPLEEGEIPPPLSEMLLAVFGGEIDDEDLVEELDARLEDDRTLLGYVREGGEVEVHSLVATPNPATRARLREVFGREIEGIGCDSTGGNASPGVEGTR